MCGKQRHFYPLVFLEFSIALEAIIMMNVFYLLTQPVAPPRGHHRSGQERCPTDWNTVAMPQIIFGRVFNVILLLNYFTI